MRERELGKALLTWDARERATGIEPLQPHEQVAELLDRDRRRVRSLTIGTLVLWILSAVGIPMFFALFCTWIMPKVVQVTREVITHSDGVEPQALADTVDFLSKATLKLSIILVTGSVAALLLAAGCTVWLVFATRRATLRQVNANLAAIAEQLSRLAASSEREEPKA